MTPWSSTSNTGTAIRRFIVRVISPVCILTAEDYNVYMATQPRRRILVALEPTVLEGAFAALLGDGERSEVVQFQKAGLEELSAHYDVAIVTSGFAHQVEPEVLITLPDTERAGGGATVTVNGVTRRVKVSTNQEVIDLLSEQFPGEMDRSVAS